MGSYMAGVGSRRGGHSTVGIYVYVFPDVAFVVYLFCRWLELQMPAIHLYHNINLSMAIHLSTCLT